MSPTAISNFTKTILPCRLILIIYPFRSIVSITNQSDPKTRVVYKIVATMKALNREHISLKLQQLLLVPSLETSFYMSIPLII